MVALGFKVHARLESGVQVIKYGENFPETHLHAIPVKQRFEGSRVDLLSHQDILRDSLLLKHFGHLPIESNLLYNLRWKCKSCKSVSLELFFYLSQSIALIKDGVLDIVRDHVDDNDWMHFEEIKVLHSGVLQELTKACDVNLIIAIEVEIATQLIDLRVLNRYTVVVKDVPKVRDSNL